MFRCLVSDKPMSFHIQTAQMRPICIVHSYHSTSCSDRLWQKLLFASLVVNGWALLEVNVDWCWCKDDGFSDEGRVLTFT